MSVWSNALWSLVILLGLVAPVAQWVGVGRGKVLQRFGVLAITVGSIVGAVLGAVALWIGQPFGLILPQVGPFPLSLTVDRLSAFFLLLICGTSLPVVLYSTTYFAKHYAEGRARWAWALLSLFVFSMSVVATASTGFTFLLGWELMTLVSAGLILLEGDSEERLHNVYIYLLMMHVGAAAVVAGFFLYWPHAPGLDFVSLRSASSVLSPAVRTAVFLLTLLGFGTKAGIIPFHLWLPRAHPIAPSPISALMSGVMLKTAIYGFVRFNFDFLDGGPDWWGYLVLAMRAISGFLGILFALAENNLKRMLAYSSIENIGIIYLALGASLLCRANNRPELAALALLAALVHSLNHALYKSLLFLGAGAIAHSTGELSQDELGGLIKRMPVTGAAFLVGCCSIAGLPLLNGFVGEWLLFRSFLVGANLNDASARVVLPLMVGVLAIVTAISAACFAKAFGVPFLGRARSDRTANAQEAPAAMRAALLVLAAACVVLGLGPSVLLSPVVQLAESLADGVVAPGEIAFFRLMPGLAAGVLLFVALPRLYGKSRRIVATWGCGLANLTPRMQYTAAAFTKPIRMVFARVYRPHRTVEIFPADQPYFPQTILYRSERTTSFERGVYRPAVDTVIGLAQRLRHLQTGNIQVYLLYIFLTLVALLFFLRFQK
ncbi:MAG: hypothetical protein L0Z53_14475 [Acidobacteriales bacterium]|nr:hypothetical protein [Terriglobales bacterium]